MTPTIDLRDVQPGDIAIFYDHQQDADALHMAAFTPKDPTDAAASQAHWERILADPTVIARTIVVDGAVAGHIAKFEMDGDAELTYWIGRDFWGKGVATRALRSFLDGVTVRPLHARVAFDNVGSMRVLEKCGFAKVGEGTWFANARNAEIIEFVYKLD